MSVLKEDNGNYSMTRILSLIIVISGIGIGLTAAILGTLNTDTTALSLGLVTIGMTGKTVSKKLEK